MTLTCTFNLAIYFLIIPFIIITCFCICDIDYEHYFKMIFEDWWLHKAHCKKAVDLNILKIINMFYSWILGFPGGTVINNQPANAGDAGDMG